MKHKLTVFLFLVMVVNCNGHLPILGNILSTAKEQVEGITGTVLGGFNLNIFGLNKQNRPQDFQQKGPEETIVVVVEEPGDNDYGNINNYGPNHNRPPPPPHNHYHGRPPLDYDSAQRPPPPHHHHQERPPLDYDSAQRPSPPHHQHQRPPVYYGSDPPPPPPNYQHTPYGDPRPGNNGENQGPYHHNEYGNNQNSGNQENDNNFSGNNQNGRPYDNNYGNSNNNGYQPNSKGTEESQEQNSKNLYDDANTNNFYGSPTTENIITPDPTNSSSVPKDDENREKSSDDRPLFVPLTPDEYVYGGDKINITAPKRDTDKIKPEETDDDDFSIDVRLKGE